MNTCQKIVAVVSVVCGAIITASTLYYQNKVAKAFDASVKE